MEHRRTASAEFPNDNPDLHDGGLWVVSRPCAPAQLLFRGAPRSESPAEPPETEFELPGDADDGLLDIDIDVELLEEAAQSVDDPPLASEASGPAAVEAVEPAVEAVEPAVEAVEPAVEAVEPPAAPAQDSFAVFVSALVHVAMDAGASRVAAGLPAFLEQGTLPRDGLAPEVVEALVSRGFAEPRDGGLGPSATCAATCGAWSRVLRGQSDDLSACGTSTLDGWAAELLAAALGAPPDAVRKLRRELRRLGVAAFGIIEQAA